MPPLLLSSFVGDDDDGYGGGDVHCGKKQRTTCSFGLKKISFRMKSHTHIHIKKRARATADNNTDNKGGSSNRNGGNVITIAINCLNDDTRKRHTLLYPSKIGVGTVLMFTVY